MEPWEKDAALERTLSYHEETKHRLDRYARNPGYLNWTDQPNPFREFAGAPQIELPLNPDAESPSFADLFSGRLPAAQPLSRQTLGLFFERSLALSAWKEIPGARWSLRVNPSSGNLHPTEAYALLPALDGIGSTPGVYHYLSRDHALELRASWESASITSGFYVAFTSISWREAWKYGERAFRYCQHDMGHALAAVSISAATLGWKAQIQTVAAEYLDWLLTLKPPVHPLEPEIPEALVWIQTNVGVQASACPTSVPAHVGVQASACPSSLPAINSPLKLFGRPNHLSPGHHPWPIIDEVASATAFSAECGVRGAESSQSLVTSAPTVWPPPTPPPCADPASRIIRQRRSATNFDGVTPLSRAAFFQLLDLTLPRAQVTPFDAWPFAPRVHLVIFVHRVTGLDPGLYVWVRDLRHLETLRAAFNPEFHWQCDQPETSPLFELGKTDLREFAQTQACHQAIASDGAFSLGMLAHFEPALRDVGPHVYRELFWETGIIGQALYLGAEAAGVRATGIGCFFDDVLHRALGLKDRTWQSLYHFTIGTPVDDPRLRTAPPYTEPRGGRSVI